MLSNPTRLILGYGVVLALVACGGESRSRTVAVEARPAGVVDSVMPIEEALRRFRAGVPNPRTLGGGFASRDSLVAGFGRSLFRADTAAIAGLLLDRAEFAYLYYPSSRFAREPYELAPEIVWLQLRSGTSKGITRALRLFGGNGHEYLGYECEAQPTLQGENRLWERCLIAYRDPSGQSRTGRFFGSILERQGRFKIVSYSNPL